MSEQHRDQAEVVRQAELRAQRIADIEKMLAHERHMQRIAAVWLVRHTSLSKGDIAAVTGSSRVSIDKWIQDSAMSAQELSRRARKRLSDGLPPELPGQTAAHD